MLRSDITQITAHFWNVIHGHKGFFCRINAHCCRELLETFYVSDVVCCRSNWSQASRAYLLHDSFKNYSTQDGNYYYRSKKTGLFLQQWIEFIVKKVVVKILQGSVRLGGLTISFGCKFPTVYTCQKLWKLASSWQSYCKNKQAYFFGPRCILLWSVICSLCSCLLVLIYNRNIKTELCILTYIHQYFCNEFALRYTNLHVFCSVCSVACINLTKNWLVNTMMQKVSQHVLSYLGVIGFSKL